MWRTALSSNAFRRHSVSIKYSQRNVALGNQEVDKKDEFKAIVYKLPYIQYAGFINRTKFFQTYVAATSATISFALYETGVITYPVFYSILYLMFALNLPFYTLGFVCTNLVGSMYVSEDQQKVKFAYLNFWGRRREIVIEKDDIAPLSEIPSNPSQMYFRVERYSQPCKLKLSLKHGKVVNTELFTVVFGSLERN